MPFYQPKNVPGRIQRQKDPRADYTPIYEIPLATSMYETPFGKVGAIPSEGAPALPAMEIHAA